MAEAGQVLELYTEKVRADAETSPSADTNLKYISYIIGALLNTTVEAKVCHVFELSTPRSWTVPILL